eukprot:1155392-Pelagomonas_calceolata.AAC.3
MHCYVRCNAQSKLDPEAPRLLLKHFTAHHGLRAASLAPYFVEFVNNLASVCWLEGVEQEVSFGSSTSSSGSSQDSKGGWTSISSLGGCEEYIVSILVSLSRSKEVDLAHGLTAPAKRLAIQLCAAQVCGGGGVDGCRCQCAAVRWTCSGWAHGLTAPAKRRTAVCSTALCMDVGVDGLQRLHH